METDRPGHDEDDIDVRLEWPSAPLTGDRSGQLVAEPAPEPVPTAGDDVDTALAAVRSDLVSLRHAVEDVGGHVHLRELHTTIDELRGELFELRRAVLERKVTVARPTGEDADSIRAELADFLAPLIEEVGGLREEVSSLRRRISLRAKGSPVELSDEQLQRIVLAIGAHLRADEGSGAQVRAR